MSSIEEDMRKALNKAPFANPFVETFNPTTDSLEAIREAITGIEAGIYTYAAKSGPDNVEINDEAEFSMELLNPGDIIIPDTAITAGNYKIDKITNGSSSPVVTETGASKAAGRIYCTEKFETASGWVVGDLFKITFSGGSVTFGDTTTALPMAYFYGRIVREEEIITEIGSKHTTTDANVDDAESKIKTDIDSKHSTTDTLIGSKHTTTDANVDDAESKIKTDIDSKHSTTDTLIGSKHTTTDANVDDAESKIKTDIDSKHSTTDTLIGSKHTTTDANVDDAESKIKTDIDSKHSTTDTLIGSKHTTTDANVDDAESKVKTDINSKHSTTDTLIGSKHDTTQSKIATVHGNVGDKGADEDILTRLGLFTTVNNLKALLGAGFTPVDNLFDVLGGYDKDDPLKEDVDFINRKPIPATVPWSKSINAYVQAIGSNDNNNEFDSPAVVANMDGSVLERLEHLKDKVSSMAIEFMAQPAQPTAGGTKLTADPTEVDDLGTSDATAYDQAAAEVKSYEITAGLDGVTKYVYVDLTWKVANGVNQRSKWMVCAGDTFVYGSAVDLTDELAGAGTFHRSGQIKLAAMDNVPFTIALLTIVDSGTADVDVVSTTELRVSMTLV